MGSNSNDMSSLRKNKVEGEVMGSKSTMCVLYQSIFFFFFFFLKQKKNTEIGNQSQEEK